MIVGRHTSQFRKVIRDGAMGDNKEKYKQGLYALDTMYPTALGIDTFSRFQYTQWKSVSIEVSNVIYA